MHPLPFSDQRFDRSDLEREQLELLNALIARARASTTFHQGRLPAEPLSSLDELATLPFMGADDLRRQEDVLLVPVQQVSRMVSLPTSGTGGEPKRIGFTTEDLAQTREFFAQGLRCITREGATTAVLFPSTTPDGMGSLICASAAEAGARVAAVDPASSVARIADDLARAGATSAVGSAHMMLALARFAERHPDALSLERVLISSDNASSSMVAAIGQGLGCEVFEHFGMTETGFGCAVDCYAHAGMHIRERDLLVEIVDPATGSVLPAGAEGEVVITTLRREALPIIRYRTGDISRLIPGDCPCGGSLRRLDRVHGHALVRSDGRWRLEALLDEVVFSLPGIFDYDARVVEEGSSIALTAVAFERVDASELEEKLAPHIASSVELQLADENTCLINPKLSRLRSS